MRRWLRYRLESSQWSPANGAIDRVNADESQAHNHAAAAAQAGDCAGPATQFTHADTNAPQPLAGVWVVDCMRNIGHTRDSIMTQYLPDFAGRALFRIVKMQVVAFRVTRCDH
jgi:hypothetical protein